jgi:hypothetical protein
MTKYYFLSLLALTLFFISCDGPKRSRVIESNTGTESGSVSGQGAASSGQLLINNTNGNTSNFNSSSNQNLDPTVDCDTNNLHYQSGLGYFGICKIAASNPEAIKFKFQIGDALIGKCLIPMHQMSNGTKTALYSQAQCVYPQAGTIYSAVFPAQQRFFPVTTYATNAILVLNFKSGNFPLVNLYYSSCVYAYSNLIKLTPGCETIPACAQAARSQSTIMCQDFLSDFASQMKIVNVNP